MRDHQPGAGVGDDVLQHSPAVGDIDGGVDRPQLVQSQESQDRLGSIRLPAEHEFAPRYAQRLKPRSARPDLFLELSPAPLTDAGEDDRRRFRRFPGAPIQHPAHNAGLCQRLAC